MTKGYKHSEETKEKHREELLHRKIPLTFAGHKHSIKTKTVMSEAMLGNKNASGNKNMLGKKHSEETKKKLSEIMLLRKKTLGYINSSEARKKVSDSWNESRIDKLLSLNHNKMYKRGIHVSLKAGNIQYRSSLELRLYKILDACNFVIFYEAEPIKIKYFYQDRMHNYVPDLRISYINGTSQIIEVKPNSYAKHDKCCQVKFAAAKALFGNNFVVITEHELKWIESE